MLVREWMTANPITVCPFTSFSDAFLLMRERKIRRLPVIEKNGSLVGIATENDLLYAAPSQASTLSIFELNTLLDRLPISQMMTCPVITVQEDCPIKQAAAIMQAKRIGGLPVMRGNDLVGILTVTDLLRMISHSFTNGASGLNVRIRAKDDKGVLALITGEIARLGGNIVHMLSYPDTHPAFLNITIKLQEVSAEDIIPLLTDIIGVDILSIQAWKDEDRATVFCGPSLPENQNRSKRVWFTNIGSN